LSPENYVKRSDAPTGEDRMVKLNGKTISYESDKNFKLYQLLNAPPFGMTHGKIVWLNEG
jgi:hypothetical protein